MKLIFWRDANADTIEEARAKGGTQEVDMGNYEDNSSATRDLAEIGYAVQQVSNNSIRYGLENDGKVLSDSDIGNV
jgi:hypothetical protein